MFVIRNEKQDRAISALISDTMRCTEGDRSEAGRVPQVRRHWIRREACRLERKVGRRCIYTDQVSRLRRQRTEALRFSNRGLTARPVV